MSITYLLLRCDEKYKAFEFGFVMVARYFNCYWSITQRSFFAILHMLCLTSACIGLYIQPCIGLYIIPLFQCASIDNVLLSCYLYTGILIFRVLLYLIDSYSTRPTR